MPENIDSRPQRRKQAIYSAFISAMWLLISAGVAWWLRSRYWPQGGVSVLLLSLVCLELGALVPLAVSLTQRLKEIEGGEIDEASQY